MTVALVTGATGQDGSYLCERLAAEGAELHAGGIENSAPYPWLSAAHVHTIDLRDGPAMAQLVADVEPAEVFNLAGVSSVAQSWTQPVLTAEVNALPVAVLLEACWELQERTGAAVRFVQASSAEIFGN